jgi:predicted aconitase with swiveling domain
MPPAATPPLALAGRVLHPGAGEGPLLRLSAPLSFWGGVDPASGRIIKGGHPEAGRSVAGTVLVLAEPIGSSSSSYVLLELVHQRLAPAAIVLGTADAILVVGCLAAREIDLVPPPILVVAPAQLESLPEGRARVAGGRLEMVGGLRAV